MISGWNFSDALAEAIEKTGCMLIGGLDPQWRYLPQHMIDEAKEKYLALGRRDEKAGLEIMADTYAAFMCGVIGVLHDIVPMVKPQRAFYEKIGPAGDEAFVRVVQHAHDAGLLVTEDAKRGDGGDTADAYADGHIGEIDFLDGTTITAPGRVDCMTIHGYIAQDCVCRFIKRGVKEHGTGIFVVTKTSFNPNSRLENLPTLPDGTPVWQGLAHMVKEWGEGTEGECGLRNVGVVMGSTYPKDADKMREILPNVWFLKPGYGGQGATAEDSVVGILPNGLGIVVNNSRNLTYCYRDLKDKEHGCPMICEPSRCFDMIRERAIKDRDALVAAARAIGKWPF